MARATSPAPSRPAPARLHPGRLALLALVLIAAAFYVSPLRAFFTQQDRYERQVVALTQANAENHALHTQIAKLKTGYITRSRRANSTSSCRPACRCSS